MAEQYVELFPPEGEEKKQGAVSKVADVPQKSTMMPEAKRREELAPLSEYYRDARRGSGGCRPARRR